MNILTAVAIGLVVGAFVGLTSLLGWWLFLGILVGGIVIIAMIDWSGEGDGREGCNRHTSCNH